MQLNDSGPAAGAGPVDDDCPSAARWTPGGAIFAAALALPGLVNPAHAESAPDKGQIDLNYQDYHDWQPGLDRIAVHSPSLRVLVPVAGVWALEGSLVSDSISGATPRFHSAISSASSMSDLRRAENIAVTRYFPQGSIKASFAHSGENDYQSRAFGLEGTRSTESKNTTFNFGAGVSNDVINPVNGVVSDAHKHVVELKAGVTQILTQRDIVQLDFSRVEENGYLNDPYKLLDQRPDQRRANILLLRWNHYLDSTEGTARFGYRYYSDSYGIHAHTASLDYVQPLAYGWTVTPSVRGYTQSAADFYFGPVYSPLLGPPIPAGFSFAPNANISEDYRLSAFGALTLALKVEKQLPHDWRISLQVAGYEQRSNWALSGSSGPALAPLVARIINIGLSKQF